MKINSVALILGILILACLMITPVMGENINGSLGSSAWNTTNYPSAESASGVAPLGAISGMVIKDIEKTSGFRSLVAFRTTAFFSGDVGAPYSAQTSVDIYP